MATSLLVITMKTMFKQKLSKTTFPSRCEISSRILGMVASKCTILFKIIRYKSGRCTVILIRDAGTGGAGGAAAPLAFCWQGQGGQKCPSSIKNII